MSEQIDLSGRRALVTGAGRGIGKAIAIRLAAAGADVAVNDLNPETASLTAGEIRALGRRSAALPGNLRSTETVHAICDGAVDALGGVDILVNNAGIPKRRWAWEHRADEVADVLRINVESPIRLTTALLPALRASGGRVVFIGSVAARLAPPSEAVYSASKAAITAYAEGLRVDLGVAGSTIGVHVVQPGVLDTELFEAPDNDPSLSDIEPLPATAIVDAVLAALDSGATETFVPEWFRDLPPVKAGDLDGFLRGSIDYTRGRLEALGLDRPDPTG